MARWQEDQRPVLWVAAIGLLIGIGVTAAAASGEDPSVWLLVRLVAVGLAYLGVGVFLARQGNTSLLPLLIVGVGLLWFVPIAVETRQPILDGIGTWFEDVYRAAFAHAILAYPYGRLEDRLSRGVVIAGYAFTIGGGLARALTYQPYVWETCECPRNAFAAFPNEDAYNTINDIYQIIGLILAVALIVLIVRKLRSPEVEEVSSGPIWTGLIASVLIVIAGVVRESFDLSRGADVSWLWVEGAALIAVALSFLALGSRALRNRDEAPQLARA